MFLIFFFLFCKQAMDGNIAEQQSNQVFSYQAPWIIYALGFSSRPGYNYRIGIGSFLEEVDNQVSNYLFSFLINLQKAISVIWSQFFNNFTENTKKLIQIEIIQLNEEK